MNVCRQRWNHPHKNKKKEAEGRRNRSQSILLLEQSTTDWVTYKHTHKQKAFFLTVLEAKMSMFKASAWLRSGQGPLPGWSLSLSHHVLTGWKGKGNCENPVIAALIPAMIRSSKRPHLLILHIGHQDFSRILRGCQHSKKLTVRADYMQAPCKHKHYTQSLPYCSEVLIGITDTHIL